MSRRTGMPNLVWPLVGAGLLIAGVVIGLAGWGNWWILVGSIGAALLGSGLAVYFRSRRE